jgi:hypothetical protein
MRIASPLERDECGPPCRVCDHTYLAPLSHDAFVEAMATILEASLSVLVLESSNACMYATCMCGCSDSGGEYAGFLKSAQCT